MVWRTLVLSAVNVVTVLLVFVPIVEITSIGFEDTLYLHSGPPYLFLIQLALGIFAVVIDMFNKRPHLQAKLLTTAVALSGTLAGIIIWIVVRGNFSGCYVVESEVKFGTWLPIFNLLFFVIVWIDQRRNFVK